MKRVMPSIHPLTSPLAAHVDVAIIRVAEVAVATAFELSGRVRRARELDSSGESGPPCGVPSTLGLTSPFSITPAFKNARMSFNRPACPRLVLQPDPSICHD